MDMKKLFYRSLRYFILATFLYSTLQLVNANQSDKNETSLLQRRNDFADITTLEIPRPEKEKSADSFATLMIVVIEFVAFIINYILHETHFKYLQEAGASVILGGLLSLIIRYGAGERLHYYITFETEFFYLILLPPIIFESGYNMRRRKFFDNIVTILVMAFLGTTIATFITGGLLYALTLTNLIPQLNLIECMLFGALISATDPVTVLAIFKALRVDLDLYSNIFGESVLNDAVAIVLYKTIYVFAERELNAVSILAGIGEFTLIFGGSTAIGIIVGLISALLFKYTRMDKNPLLETSLLSMFAYSSYLLAEGFELSGIVAILFTGITMAHYTINNMSEKSRDFSIDFFSLLATLADTLVFLFLGMALFAFEGSYNFPLIAFSIIIILFARAVHIFPICLLTNAFRKPEKRVPPSHQFFIWFAGLRGGIAFTLAIELRENQPTLPSLGTQADSIFSTTLMISFFTILFLGGITVPLLEKLKIPMGVDVQSIQSTENRNIFYRFDKNYLKKFFLRGNLQYQPFKSTEPEDIELTEEAVTITESNSSSPSEGEKTTKESQVTLEE